MKKDYDYVCVMDDTSDLSKAIYDSFNTLYEKYKEKPVIHDYSISLIAYYDDIIYVLNDMVKKYDFKMIDIRIEPEYVEHYFDEWLLTIDSDKEIFIQKAVNENKSDKEDDLRYFRTFDDIIYIDNDSIASLEYCRQNTSIEDCIIIKYSIKRKDNNNDNENKEHKGFKDFYKKEVDKKQENKETDKKETDKESKCSVNKKNKKDDSDLLKCLKDGCSGSIKFEFEVEPTLKINTKELEREIWKQYLCRQLFRRNFDLFSIF